MFELTEKLQKRLDEIQPLLAEIDISQDCSPEDVGALNSVAAAGGEFSETTIKLFILNSRGVITNEEYDQFVLRYIKQA